MNISDSGCTVTFLCPPSGPDDPFGSPLLTVLDVVRVFVMVGALYTVAQSGIAIGKVDSWRQRVSYGGAILLEIYVGVTELEHIGDYAHYRLVVAVLAIGGLCWSLTGAAHRVGDWEADTQHSRVMRRRRRRRRRRAILADDEVI
jgi:hypothetical protein